jgi:exodeoxyribonuclease-3
MTSQRAARIERRERALAARAAQTPVAPAPERLRVATWNINSIRSRLPALERFVDRTKPDIVCLQETKVRDLPDDAVAMLKRLGYQIAHAGTGGYNGVAVVSRHDISDIELPGSFGDEHLDREARLVTCRVHAEQVLRVASVYVPHGRTLEHWHYQYKLAFMDALSARASHWLSAGGALIIAGDLNVAPTDSDVFHPNAFVGLTHVTPAERNALVRLFETGLVDVDAARWGWSARRFTWWKYGAGYSTNLGMRIDLIAADQELAATLDTTWIDHDERGAHRASDHAALVADFTRTDSSRRTPVQPPPNRQQDPPLRGDGVP